MTGRALVALLPLAALLAGCPAWDPMQRQAKVKPYQPSAYHADGLAMRAPPPGTVAHGAAGVAAAETGLGPDGVPLPRIPVAVTPALLETGRRRFDVHCAVCHGLLGDGESQVALVMSLRRPPSLHLYRDVPDGYLYQVISQGFGLMPAYAADLPPQERWGVVAYVRALQLSQRAPVGALPAPVRSELERRGP
jgi:mono/diheme cytochrome c family protein